MMSHPESKMPPGPQPSSLRTLAHLLHRMEGSSGRMDAGQYRVVASRLAQALEVCAPGRELDAVLATYPGAELLYENCQYAHAGLCRSDLERAMAAELAARALIERARHGAPQGEQGTAHGQE